MAPPGRLAIAIGAIIALWRLCLYACDSHCETLVGDFFLVFGNGACKFAGSDWVSVVRGHVRSNQSDGLRAVASNAYAYA
jgi:hypothetical protein